MLVKVHSAALIGLTVHEIEVEIDSSFGISDWQIVGLPDTSVKESKERVRTALKNSGFDFPPRVIVINMAPADLKKEGPSFDLPIAIAILAATEQVPAETLDDLLFIGELGLDGAVRPVRGMLPLSIENAKTGLSIVTGVHSATESAVGGSRTYGFNNLREVAEFLHHRDSVEPVPAPDLIKVLSQAPQTANDFSEIHGQKQAKRALEIAAAGGHNVIMTGSPGSGKTMLARAFPSILPPLTEEECIECSKIYSIAGQLSSEKPLVTERPFRAPHHTSSVASIIGGGSMPTPGEVSLSHNGVLFMDEFPEFSKGALEALRQPLEDGIVTISRVSAQLTFPCNFILLAAMNPCPCGYLNDPRHPCTCSEAAITRYRHKISGPLMDRFDIQLDVFPVEFNDLYDNTTVEESSAEVRKRVTRARAIQTQRFKDEAIFCNANMNQRQIRKYCVIDDTCKRLMQRAFEKMGISARANNRILKLSRTIADLDGSESIRPQHIAEAISYREHK
jgi:magnesium chelatase family protein